MDIECERALREYEQQRVWTTTAQQEAEQVLHRVVQVMLRLARADNSQDFGDSGVQKFLRVGAAVGSQ